jgi:hypothetical protein
MAICGGLTALIIAAAFAWDGTKLVAGDSCGGLPADFKDSR